MLTRLIKLGAQVVQLPVVDVPLTVELGLELVDALLVLLGFIPRARKGGLKLSAFRLVRLIALAQFPLEIIGQSPELGGLVLERLDRYLKLAARARCGGEALLRCSRALKARCGARASAS